jgi:hypothetical protein
MTQSVRGFYRIRTTHQCYYYCPQDIEQWNLAVGKWGPVVCKPNSELDNPLQTSHVSGPVIAFVAAVALTGMIGHAFIVRLEKSDLAQPPLPLSNLTENIRSVPANASWVRTESGPRLSEPFALHGLRLDESQREQFDQILSRMEQQFYAWEKQVIERVVREDGRIDATIPAQPEKIVSFQNELWLELDRILSLEQQETARRNLNLGPATARPGAPIKELVAPAFFGWCEHGARIEIWRVGTWYHWRISTRGFDLEQQGPELPLELQRIYGGGDPNRPAVD